MHIMMMRPLTKIEKNCWMSCLRRGIGRVINVCAEVEGWDRTVDLMERYPYIYGAVGVHPDDVGALDEEKIQRMHQSAGWKKRWL